MVTDGVLGIEGGILWKEGNTAFLSGDDGAFLAGEGSSNTGQQSTFSAAISSNKGGLFPAIEAKGYA